MLNFFWGGGEGYVKNRTSGRVRKNRNSRGGTKILVGMEKNYFLSMLPLVGESSYSKGLLLLAGSRRYLPGGRASSC